VGENPGQRAANVYSAVGTKYSAPKYSASVGDALTCDADNKFLMEYIFFTKKEEAQNYSKNNTKKEAGTLTR
jgi:hypothetical protein